MTNLFEPAESGRRKAHPFEMIKRKKLVFDAIEKLSQDGRASRANIERYLKLNGTPLSDQEIENALNALRDHKFANYSRHHASWFVTNKNPKNIGGDL